MLIIPELAMPRTRKVTTVCNGKLLMKDRKVLVCDEAALMKECRQSASRLWDSINN